MNFVFWSLRWCHSHAIAANSDIRQQTPTTAISFTQILFLRMKTWFFYFQFHSLCWIFVFFFLQFLSDESSPILFGVAGCIPCVVYSIVGINYRNLVVRSTVLTTLVFMFINPIRFRIELFCTSIQALCFYIFSTHREQVAARNHHKNKLAFGTITTPN